jgi:hypothetical protein
LPWEVTLGGACTLAIVFAAFYAKKTELALSMVRCGGPPPQPASPPHSADRLWLPAPHIPSCLPAA